MAGFKVGRSMAKRRWLITAAVGIALVLVALAVGASLHDDGASPTTAGSAAPPTVVPVLTAPAISTAGFPSGVGKPGIFTDVCKYSHSAADDPILDPGHPGAAMHHDFYGSTSTTAMSTAAALVGTPTTCSTAADSSAYWTPVLYQNGAALTPKSSLIYWRRPAKDADAVQTIPVGLQIIAGDEAAMSPQPKSVTAWTCSGVVGHLTNTPHDCQPGQYLRLVVTFPSCWDGHTLAGADQKNVVYRDPTGCPSSHPIQIPQIVFHVNYPTASASGLSVSMTPTMQGSTDTEHVDFINGWQQPLLDRNVTACIATSTRCGPAKGAGAVPQGGKDR
jgi:hypothetical protein